MVYKLPFYFTLIPVIITLLACGVGVFTFRRSQTRIIAFACLGVALLTGGLIAPMLYLDRVVLDDTKLEQTTGFWFSPTIKGFTINDVQSIQLDTAVDRQDREYEVWIIYYKNGSVQVIDPGDLWEMNGQDILQRLENKGIIIE